MVLRTTSYRLRASTPQPSKGRCADPLLDPNPPTIGFVLQTFKAEKQTTDQCEDQSRLLCSNDMLGLGGQFVSASYTAQRFLDPNTGELVFTSQESREAEIIEEDAVPGVSNL